MNMFEKYLQDHDSLPALSFPGFYPLFYVNHVNAIFCADCATKYADEIEKHGIHWEGEPLICDVCNCEIHSAYGDNEEEGEG